MFTFVSMPWYEDWFDSKYYHILYKSRDNKEAARFIDNLLQLLNAPPDSNILDAACGTGRHAIYINRKGFEVTGIDLAPNSIKKAAKATNERLYFYRHDMRKPFKEGHFDYVFNCFTSFGYFESETDNQDTINSFSMTLKPLGILVIDFFNATKVAQSIVPKETKTIDGIKFNIQKRIENGYIIKSITIEDKGEKVHFEEKVQLLQLKDFEGYFTKANLRVVNLYGDYDLNTFDEKTSDRLILIVQK